MATTPTTPFQPPRRLRDRETGAEDYAAERLQRRALEAVEYWVNAANRIFAGRDRMPMPLPECRFDLQGTCAGQACFPGSSSSPAYMRINTDLLERYPVRIIQQTVPHEVAHLVQRRIWGACQAHGREWKSVMVAFGKKPERTHDLTVKPYNASDTPFVCGCEDRAHYLSDKHLTVIAKGGTLSCNRCGQPLVEATPDDLRPPTGTPTSDRASPDYAPISLQADPSERERLRKLGYMP